MIIHSQFPTEPEKNPGFPISSLCIARKGLPLLILIFQHLTFFPIKTHFHKHIFVLYSETRCQSLNVRLQKHTPTYGDHGIFRSSPRGELDPTTPNVRATACRSQNSLSKKGGLTSSSPRFLRGSLSLWLINRCIS